MTTLKGSGMTQPTFSGVCLWDSLSSIMKAQKIVLSPTMLKYEDRHIRLHQGHSYELLKWWSFSYYFTLSFTFWPLAWEKVMAPHSSTLAWRIPWMEEPGGLQSMGSLRVGTERLHFHFSLSCIWEGNGTPLQCSCLENPRDGGAWWAAVYGVTQNRTQLKRLSSTESRLDPCQLRSAQGLLWSVPSGEWGHFTKSLIPLFLQTASSQLEMQVVIPDIGMEMSLTKGTVLPWNI